jgi:hypothetical protein
MEIHPSSRKVTFYVCQSNVDNSRTFYNSQLKRLTYAFDLAIARQREVDEIHNEIDFKEMHINKLNKCPLDISAASVNGGGAAQGEQRMAFAVEIPAQDYYMYIASLMARSQFTKENYERYKKGKDFPSPNSFWGNVKVNEIDTPIF